MKIKILAIITVLVVLLTSCASNPDFVSSYYTLTSPDSSAIFVYDIKEDTVVFTNNDGGTVVYPASITKLATALYALSVLSADTLINPGDEVYIPSGNASSAYIRPNHILSLDMLIEGMMLPSGNDAAYAVAAAVGRAACGNYELDYESAVSEFVKGLNSYLKDIGCKGTCFTTPDGLAGDEHYSTLRDILIITKEALGNDIIMKYADLFKDDVIYHSGHTNSWTNTNKQLDPQSEYYNENVHGLKTGSLDKNFSIVTYYDDGASSLIIGVFGAQDSNGRYDDTCSLIKLITEYKKELMR